MRTLLIAILAAGVSASAAARSPAPPEPGLDEYEKPSSASALAPRLPEGRVGADQVSPCLEAPDRPICLLRTAARHGWARELRWDLRFFDHQNLLREAGVLALADAELTDVQDVVAEAVWRSVERQRAGQPLAAALEPIRRIGALRGRPLTLSAWTPARMRMEGYRAILEARAYAPARVRASLDALAPSALSAWKAEYLRARGRDRSAYPDAAALAAALAEAGDEAGAAQVDGSRRLRRRRDDQYVALSRRVAAAVTAGRLDEAYALLDRPPPPATPLARAALAAERVRLIEAAEAGGRQDLALALAHTAAADAFPVGATDPDVATLAAVERVFLRYDVRAAIDLALRLEAISGPRTGAATPPPSFHMARRLLRFTARHQRATALAEAWIPILRRNAGDADADRALRQILIEEDRFDEALAIQVGRPAETLAEALAFMSVNDPRLRSWFDRESPERRAAAYHACATYQTLQDLAERFQYCMSRFEPAAAPVRVVVEMGARAFRASSLTSTGRRQPRGWKDEMLTTATALWRDAARRDARQLATGQLLPFQVVDVAVRDLRDQGRLAE